MSLGTRANLADVLASFDFDPGMSWPLSPECSAQGFWFQGWGPGVQEVTKSRCAGVRKASPSASARKRPRVLRILGSRTWSSNADLSALFARSLTKLPTVTRIGAVAVTKRRTVVTFGLASGRHISKAPTVTWIGGSWSQNPELSSLLDSRLVVAIGGVLVAKRRTVVTLSTCVWSSRLKSAKRRRDEGGPGHET